MANQIACYLELKQSPLPDDEATPRAEAPAPSAVEAARTGRADDLYRAISTTYHSLRLLMAGLALALPWIVGLIADPPAILPSLSAYYHYDVPDGTAYGAGDTRDIFVGILAAIGAFLIGYRGYSQAENIALNVAGVSAIIVALFPTAWHGSGAIAGVVHTAGAVFFFLAVAFVCLTQSETTLTLVSNEARQRTLRTIYKLLGWLMVGLPLAVLALYLLDTDREGSIIIYLLEVIAIYVFAFFWIVKSGELREIERESGLTGKAVE
jgi:hypothetical protein